MCDVSSLFCKYGSKYIEGYLGDENSSPELLFVLKEPHASPDNVTDFWFKTKVMPDSNRMSNQYFKVLSKTAMKLIGTPKDSYDSVLSRCAFINIYPFSGGPSASNRFKTVAEAIKEAIKNAKPMEGKPITNQSCCEEIACNRIAIIRKYKWKYVVTVDGVFEKLHPRSVKYYYGFESKEMMRKRPAFDLNGTTFLKIHHPKGFSDLELETMEFNPKK